jgi:rhamnulokinase
MPKKIQDFCHETGQPIPETKGEIIRCIYESLALRYSQVWQSLMQHVDQTPNTLHIVGGGCQDNLLNQFAANAIGVTVAACPVEATGLGNIMTQMLADNAIDSVAEGRQIILNSSLVETFEPADQVIWAEAKARFATVSK